MRFEPPSLDFSTEVTCIVNFVAIPFCLGALVVYVYNVIFEEFRSYKFGLTLLIVNYICVTQTIYRFYASIEAYTNSFGYWFGYFLVYYSYILAPLKTWLFCAQYFESASLIVEFEGKQKTRKYTKILFAVVTAA